MLESRRNLIDLEHHCDHDSGSDRLSAAAMILLCGIPSEAPLSAVIEAAERLGVPHAVFNQREARHTDLVLYRRRGRIEGVIRIRGSELPLTSIRGVFVRLMDERELVENRARGRWSPASIESMRSSILHSALIDWLEIAECRVLNRAGSMASNMSKPYQAQRILESGFAVPATIVTNDPQTVRAFARRFRRIVFKSASSVRSVVQELHPEKMQELERVRLLPTQFQEYVAGTNVRVHVVGTRFFATEILTEAVDYRYASGDDVPVTLRIFDLPREVADRCLALSRRLDLPLVGVDLIRTPKGRYYCLEANPSPAYTYYQEHTGQPISDAIVRYLAEGR